MPIMTITAIKKPVDQHNLISRSLICPLPLLRLAISVYRMHPNLYVFMYPNVFYITGKIMQCTYYLSKRPNVLRPLTQSRLCNHKTIYYTAKVPIVILKGIRFNTFFRYNSYSSRFKMDK